VKNVPAEEVLRQAVYLRSSLGRKASLQARLNTLAGRLGWCQGQLCACLVVHASWLGLGKELCEGAFVLPPFVLRSGLVVCVKLS